MCSAVVSMLGDPEWKREWTCKQCTIDLIVRQVCASSGGVKSSMRSEKQEVTPRTRRIYRLFEDISPRSTTAPRSDSQAQ